MLDNSNTIVPYHKNFHQLSYILVLAFNILGEVLQADALDPSNLKT